MHIKLDAFIAVLLIASMLSCSTYQISRPDSNTVNLQTRYNLQMGEELVTETSIIQYNITAVAQNNSIGYGPAYLVNGLTDKGYWYQAGIAYNWFPLSDKGRGFTFIYAVFAPNGSIIFPSRSNSAGLQSFMGSVNDGDLIQVTISIWENDVLMSAYDWNTGASVLISYNSFNATKFVGGQENQFSQKGFFTGVMTEQYFPSAKVNNLKFVQYISSSKMDFGLMFIDMVDNYNNSIIFEDSQVVSLANGPEELSIMNLSEFATGYGFYTGSIANRPISFFELNMSYSRIVSNLTSIYIGKTYDCSVLANGSNRNQSEHPFFPLPDRQLDIGQSVQLCISSSNLSKSEEISWMINSTEVILQKNFSSLPSGITFVPSAKGLYIIAPKIFESNRSIMYLAKPIVLRVNPALRLISLSYSKSENTLYAKLEGGSPPFTFTWYIGNEMYAITSQPFISFPKDFQPEYLHVMINDSAGSYIYSGIFLGEELKSGILSMIVILIDILLASALFSYFLSRLRSKTD